MRRRSGLSLNDTNVTGCPYLRSRRLRRKQGDDSADTIYAPMTHQLEQQKNRHIGSSSG